VPPIFELGPIADGGNNGSGSFGADAFDLAMRWQTSALNTAAISLSKMAMRRSKSRSRSHKLADCIPSHRCQFVSLIGPIFPGSCAGCG
jgi:hypothetical protein